MGQGLLQERVTMRGQEGTRPCRATQWLSLKAMPMRPSADQLGSANMPHKGTHSKHVGFAGHIVPASGDMTQPRCVLMSLVLTMADCPYGFTHRQPGARGPH